MDALVSAMASDLIGRLISFLIGKYQESSSANTTDTAVRLQRALLRARVVVEEAEGRQISNRAMLEQLNQLKRELCRAAYAIDAFRWRATDLNRSRRSHTRPPPCTDCSDLLPVTVESLEATLSDMREFVVLLSGCPRVTRQPYNTYLFMENCMFGRQIEKEEIIGFLLRFSHDLDVLPIIGPHEVGKRTLVEHVCLDERVRERFVKIHRLSSNDLDDLRIPDHHWSLFDFTAKSLMVIDIVDDDMDAEKKWRWFHSAVRRRARGGSKIIVISRTEAHSSFGTVPVLRLCPPRREELWYFFRVLAFGASDPDDRPDLARIAMTVCEDISDVALFAAANVAAASLRVNLNARFWRRVRKMYAEATVLQLGDKGEFYYLCRPVTDAPTAPFLFCNRRKLTGMAGSEFPKVRKLELLTGDTLPPAGETRFDVLIWQSRIPPYVSYVATCDMEARQVVVAGEKRVRKRGRDTDQKLIVA